MNKTELENRLKYWRGKGEEYLNDGNDYSAALCFMTANEIEKTDSRLQNTKGNKELIK